MNVNRWREIAYVLPRIPAFIPPFIYKIRYREERHHCARDITYTIKKSTHKHKKRTFTSEGRKEQGWWSSIHIHKRTHARRGEEKKEGVWNLMLLHHLT